MSIYFQTGSWFTQFNKSLIKALQQCKLDHVLQRNTCLILMSLQAPVMLKLTRLSITHPRENVTHTKKYTIDVIV